MSERPPRGRQNQLVIVNLTRDMIISLAAAELVAPERLFKTNCKRAARANNSRPALADGSCRYICRHVCTIYKITSEPTRRQCVCVCVFICFRLARP